MRTPVASAWTLASIGAHAPVTAWILASFAVLEPAASAQSPTWIRQIGTPSSELVNAAAIDGTTGLFGCGFTFGPLGGPNTGAFDAWLARYDGSGNQTWLRQFGTTTDATATAVASDGAGGSVERGPG
jgi:hypothetical protein